MKNSSKMASARSDVTRYNYLILSLFLLTASPWSCCLAEEGGMVGPEASSEKTRDLIIHTVDNLYYYGDRQLEFGTTGGELFTELYANPTSKRMANSARRRLKMSNVLFIPLTAVGVLSFVRGEALSKDGHEDTGEFLRGVGGVMVLVGVTLKVAFFNSGKNRYAIAIEQFNSSVSRDSE